MEIRFKPMRSKYWKSGMFYIIPTIVYRWNKIIETPDEIHLYWLSYQLIIYIPKRKEDDMKK